VSLRLLLSTIWRETRGAPGRLFFLCTCIAVGVSAVVGVAGLVEAIERGLRVQSRELLGGDVALESRRPLPEVLPYLPRDYRSPPPPQVELRILSTMVRAASGKSRLAEVKAIDATRGAYPLAGQLLLEPARPLSELLDDDSVLAAPELLEDLKLAPGDALHVGGQRLRVSGVIKHEPDPLSFTFSFGPRVIITKRALERTGLLGFGNRVRHRTVLAFPGATTQELAQIKQQLLATVPGAGTFVNVETHDEAQPALRGPLTRAQRYFGLVALLSLLVASVGVAQIVATWMAQATPETAILRCLGLRPREVACLYVAHLLLLALIGSCVGAAAGALLPPLFVRAQPGLFPIELAFGPPWRPALRGVALGVGVSLLFSLPALTSVWKVPPARVLRSEAAPLRVPPLVRGLAGSLAIGAVFAASLLQSGRVDLAAGFAGGVAGLAALLWLAARGLSWAVGRLPRARLPALIWQGAAALGRPGAGTTGSVVALGMGTLVVVGIALLQGILGTEIDQALPPDAPSVFLLDIQPDQWPEVQNMSRAAGAQRIVTAPVVTARLFAIDGRPVDQLARERPGDPNARTRSHWVLTREQRITIMRELPADNRIVAGKLWGDPSPNELSVEVGFAQSLGVGVGAVLTFDIQGVRMDFKITSLRTLDFRTFAMNFFVVSEPGPLDQAPQILLAGVRLPVAAEQGLQDGLAARFPNITVMRVQGLLKRAGGILDQIALAVRLLGSFAVVTGLIILAGSIASSQLRRAREAALLKTLGITRPRIIAMFALEYALSGAVAGTLGALAGYLLTAFLASQLLDLSTPPSWQTCLVAVLGAIALSVLAGLAASARALVVRPLEVFRQQG
jgi:putative ABC transport system permease protein